MNDLETRLRAKIEDFVAELTEIVREEALEQVASALGGATSRVRQVAKPRASGGGRAPKRTQSDLAVLEGKIIRHIAKSPGAGARDIAEAFGLTTADITLPLRRLVVGKKLRTKGQKRGTQYHPAR